MTHPHQSALRPTALLACTLALLAMSNISNAQCNWNGSSATYMNFEHNLGSAWIARDAPVGSVIMEQPLSLLNQQGAAPLCYFDQYTPTTAVINSSVAPVPGLIARAGSGRATDILPTNIAGIGAIFEVGYPYDGSASNTFTPDDGSIHIPYKGTMVAQTAFAAPLRRFYGTLTLVKTGPIAAGPQIIDQEMFHAFIANLGKAYDFRLKGRVQQAQCSLKADPVSADPVRLGDYEVADFKTPGTTTADIPFFIRLNDCEDDSTAGKAVAFIHLTGAKGSTTEDASAGIITLDSGASATGLGIQVLHDDGRPLELEQEVAVSNLQIGETRLNLKARYIQIAPKVTPGLASGALNFTISYR
ncbi:MULTISPECIES: fimbrial protein [Pseudomonas]|uniref:Type 1 fimbrial protein n=1 Tax=Pseudomonas juntendi TaxID=2666183 RepID=A0A7W2KEQ1_9PSED|nr:MULTISPECIES: fimbrial protein [Pseudomonas]MBA6097014.1 type 1 fimbrial protein [Pseudomonas juntendi]